MNERSIRMNERSIRTNERSTRTNELNGEFMYANYLIFILHIVQLRSHVHHFGVWVCEDEFGTIWGVKPMP